MTASSPKKKENTKKLATLVLIGGLVVVSVMAFSYTVLPHIVRTQYDTNTASVSSSSSTTPALPSVKHVETPSAVKAIYMSQCAVGTPSFRKSLEALIDKTEVNAIVIDIKDYTGKISFPTNNPVLKDRVSTACGAKDMKDYVKKLHDKNIYVIGRVTVFQDPYQSKLHPELAVRRKSDGGVWVDYKGLSFIDVGARAHWDYIAALAKESYNLGFDEINFDYVRFPSDGNMEDTDFTYDKGKTKAEAVREFFEYLHNQLAGTGMKTSADLFGMTTTNFDDLNIGQVLENALPYFDFIYPMVYPSHYPPKFNGYANPNKYPYEIVNYSMSRAVGRAVASTTALLVASSTPIASTTPQLYQKPIYDKQKLRPWLQDFNYGGNYGPKEIQAQIKATYDAGLTGWLFWDAGNKYSGLETALNGLNKKEAVSTSTVSRI